MEAASTSGTSANVYQITRHYKPEDSHLQTRRRENLKSYSVQILSPFFDVVLFNKMQERQVSQ
jgi:hypothetical protein